VPLDAATVIATSLYRLKTPLSIITTHPSTLCPSSVPSPPSNPQPRYVSKCCGDGLSECERYATPLCLNPASYTPAKAFYSCHREVSPSSGGGGSKCPWGFDRNVAADGAVWCQAGDFGSCAECEAALPGAHCILEHTCAMNAMEW